MRIGGNILDGNVLGLFKNPMGVQNKYGIIALRILMIIPGAPVTALAFAATLLSTPLRDFASRWNVYKKVYGAGQTVTYMRGDITKSRAEYIVNAANQDLANGGGVCGAIFEKAGPKALESACSEAMEGKKVNVGSALLTRACHLAKTNGTKGIIHAVAPDMRKKPANPDDLLLSAYESALNIAKQKGAKSIAFPLLGAGIYRVSSDKSASIFLTTVQKFFKDNPDKKMDVQMVLFDASAFNAFTHQMK